MRNACQCVDRRERGERWHLDVHGGRIEKEFRAGQASPRIDGIQGGSLRGRGNGSSREIMQQRASGCQHDRYSGSVQPWTKVTRQEFNEAIVRDRLDRFIDVIAFQTGFRREGVGRYRQLQLR